MQLSRKIKICRQENRLTQEGFAHSLNVSRKTVSGWENGRSYPDLTTLIKISDLYNISLDVLLKDSSGTIDYYQSHITNNIKIQKRTLILYVFLIINFVLLLIQYLTSWKAPYHSVIIFFLVSLISYLILYPAKNKFNSIKYLFRFSISFISTFFIYSIGPVFSNNFVFSKTDVYWNFGIIIAAFFVDFLLSLATVVLIFFIPKEVIDHFKESNYSK